MGNTDDRRNGRSRVARLTAYLRFGIAIGVALAAPCTSAQYTVDRLKSLPDPPKPKIVIIIDDVGTQWREGLRASQLPGPLGYAILPHTPYSERLAEIVHASGKQVLLHLPMQPVAEYKPHEGMLTENMSHADFMRTLAADLAAVPYVTGINNHMGSLLTQQASPMRWLMNEIRRRGDLFFIDSRTTAKSVAGRTARHEGIPTLSRDVFLDHSLTPSDIARQFERLVFKAYRQGIAIAIGHPHESTLDLLEQRLTALDRYGVELISPREALSHPPGPHHYASFSTGQPQEPSAPPIFSRSDETRSWLTP